MKWSVVYKKAYNDDGSLFFPEKLTQEFLESAKRTMGSYIFANQYLNEIIPLEKQTFKRDWFKYYESLPTKFTTFIHIDPALSEADGSDYTGVTVVHVDISKNWYVPFARRYQITPTETINLIFELNRQFKPNIIGIESVAYQKALLYFLDEEMRRRNTILPVKDVMPPTNRTKQSRILSLVPRFEWGHVWLNKGLTDLELELLKFPRASHDDLIDSLASHEYIYYPPEEKDEPVKKPNSPNSPTYEKWFIEQLRLGKDPRDSGRTNE